MNWKAFLIACTSAAATLFPGNGITCGGSEDPHDYFTSFFSNAVANGPEYRPFYYTSLLKFYDEDTWWEKPDDSLAVVDPAIAREWQAYGKSSSREDAIQLVYFSKTEDLQALAESIQTGKALPQRWQKNSLAQHFRNTKMNDAIRYLLFVKKTAPVSNPPEWEAQVKDSLQINRFIGEANEAYAKAPDAFLKDKWAFQRCKLSFYNNRHTDCIRWYDEHFTGNHSSAVANLALSYKAGSLFRTHQPDKAAYHYSKAFQLSDRYKKSNYTGFLWASDFCNQDLIAAYTSHCKNEEEKATMTAMFGMYGTDYRLPILQTVYSLQPSSPLLPLLATREIHKLEEQYFTPLLSHEKGGKSLYVSYTWHNDSTALRGHADGLAQVQKTAAFFEKLMQDKRVQQPGLYAAGAAYLRFMAKDYAGAKAVLAKASDSDEKIKTQMQLINLLVAANEDKTLTREREAKLLPSLQWLVQKARENNDFEIFCRNFFSQILAQRYEQQGDSARAALAYGLSDLTFLVNRRNNDYNYSSPTAIWYARDEMSTESLLQLYNLMTAPTTATEKFLVQYASIRRDDVIDVIGTSHLRDRDYAKAIEWLNKAGKPQPLVEERYDYKTDESTTINVDPFFDYLNDWQRFNKAVPVPYTKLTLAKKLQELETKIKSVTRGTDPSRLYYQYASALYNMSYYGNSWQALAYYRSGGNWNHGNYKLPWEKEYYGVHTAKQYYQKAYETATNKEFKAACLFMVAKCAQRQVVFPDYGDYPTYEAYEKAEAAAQHRFQNNALFAQFKKSFGTTKFYQYTYNRCSYLRDYVKKEQPSGRAR
ncbi:MAG TPA: hypothetical protein VGN63_12850 [Flavisolibacter sp.]|jgi:hypothetical protein|nr:hypothetical protein [Flavisolibacter sp.]